MKPSDLDPNAALRAAHRAREAYERHERRIDVQMSLLTDAAEGDRVDFRSTENLCWEDDSDVTASPQDQLKFPD